MFLPDLAQENPLVAEYLLQNALWWAESGGIDGFRIDTFPYVPRTFWSYYHNGLFSTYPHFFTVGEIYNYRSHGDLVLGRRADWLRRH